MNGASPQVSPFDIPREDVEALCANPGFQVLRRYLATQAEYVHTVHTFLYIFAYKLTNISFCSTHSHSASSSPSIRETWLLHRDILHALTMPVVAMFKRASALAGAALCIRTDTTEPSDLELAFTGDARGAYVWLHCFMGEEEHWARTSGCPACITASALHTESHIRLIIAASLLSTADVSSPNSSASSPASSPASEEGPEGAATMSGGSGGGGTLTLPSLPHILPALREALAKDPFWGPDYFPYILSKATQLSAGIQALISDCVDLESLVSSPETANAIAQAASIAPRNNTVPAVVAVNIHNEDQGMRIKKSKIAKRQLRMQDEEVELMRRWAMQCWARAAVPSKIRNEVLGIGRGERRRSLTCP